MLLRLRSLCFGCLVLTQTALAEEATREEVLAAMRPYEGPATSGVARTTLNGKVMAGYQGWFTAQGDGAGMGWRHYSRRGQFKPGACNDPK